MNNSKHKKFLVFDMGASSIKSMLFSFDGKKVHMERLDKFENKPVLINNNIYWNIFEIFSNIKTGIKKASVKLKKIKSVGIDGWGSDFCIFDKNKKIISNPVNYRDRDRILYSKQLYDILPKEKIFELTGHAQIPLIDMFHLFSLKIQDSPEFKEGHRYLSIPDSLNFFLTGNMYNEYTRASTSGLVNQRAKKWEASILKVLGFPKRLFGKFIMPGNSIGKTSNYVCNELEIEPIEVIAPASHDTASAVTGIPVRKEDRQWLFLSMGTWFCFGAETREPVINKKVFCRGFANEAASEGKNLLFKNLNGFWIIEKCKERWEKEANKKIPWEEIISLSDKSKPFKSCIDTDNSIFYGYQFNMPEEVRLFCKKSNQNIPDSIGEIARCIFESLVFKVVDNINLIEEILGYKNKVLYLMGGVTQNRFICQWIANATDNLVIVCPSETTSIGNFLMQLKSFKEIKKLSEGRKIISNSVNLVKYFPEENDEWNMYYDKFHNIII